MIKLFIAFLIFQVIQAQHFEYFTHVLPHPDKVHKGGEDAFYVNSHLLAVADGVGGWNQHGVDPSIYSKTLCKNIEKHNQMTDPKEIMKIAANLTNHIEGSSTLVILKLSEYNLSVANMGDCAYTIIRNRKILHQSDEQQHSFNFPFQLGQQGDHADLAQEFQHIVQQGDIIIVGSDGLYDNLDQRQILSIVLKYGYQEQIAKQLADSAYQYSLNQTYISPFAKRAQKQKINFKGGKSDDITVVVAQVVIDTDL